MDGNTGGSYMVESSGQAARIFHINRRYSNINRGLIFYSRQSDVNRH